jgi:hypothetical protein
MAAAGLVFSSSCQSLTTDAGLCKQLTVYIHQKAFL